MMGQAQFLEMMTGDFGAGAVMNWCSRVAKTESATTSVELAPARNLQAGHESLAGPAWPEAKGQSSL